jgi:hypothetical protein
MLNLRYTYSINNDNKVYLFAGCYLGFVLSGKDSDGNKTIIGNESTDDLRRFDTGIDIGAGYQYKKIILSLGYYLGLYNTFPDDKNGQNDGYKNRILQVSVGYKF